MKIKLTDPNAGPVTLPSFATPGSAAVDLCSNENCIIYPNGSAIISTGIAMAIPKGVAGLICSRSGLAAKNQVLVLNAPGVIDSDYRGEIKVILHNLGQSEFVVTPGMRIAQMMFVPLFQFIPQDTGVGIFEIVDSLDDTVRGEGGFGSTGV